MAITLKLREEERQLVVTFDDQTVKTALETLPAIDRLQADPFTNGQVLTAALGGDEMLMRLADDPDNLILLDCDDKADAFAWEFATLPDRQFLCVKAGMLRTVNKTSEVFKTSEVSGALNFIALAADPLVDEGGNPRDEYRLDLDNEMRSIRETLQNSGKNLTARRIPPTREYLNRALRQGPAVLHLTCHGNVVDTPSGKLAVLALENKDGSIDPLTGADLLNMSPRGVLRMVLLSSCMTATGSQANLARALALNGVPFAIGMQESFPDPLSDDLAVALYDSLFSGLSIGEALRQVRINLTRHPQSVGLPVGYVSANGWSEAFPIQQGTPSVGGLGKPGESALGGEIQPPRPLLGRNLELHQIAKHFASGASGGKVITVAGTGGMGKTALAAAFAERFAWMWTRGVSGYSFANEVNAANFRYALMRVLFGEDGAQKGASLSESQQGEAILKAAREWSGLWLFDNYESIIQGIQENQHEAESIHRLIADLANGEADMLLTSREQPAGLRNERLFPDGNHALHGLGDEAGVELFFQHSVKAKEKAKEDARAHADFALAVKRAADGHPLAIALLAGEYDVSAVPMQAFLGNWQDELANARRVGLAEHHVTFTIAFERSYAHLSKDLQDKLASLSIFPFPFFAHGAVMIWDGSPLPDGEEEIDAKVNAAQQTLSEFTRRSLLEVDATYDDDTPRTYRFQPALRQEAARRLNAALMESQQVGYAAYGAWLANRGYGNINSDIALNRVVRLSMDAMEKATDALQGVQRLWHIRGLAWLKNAWGETHAAFELLNSAISQNLPDPQADPESAKVEGSLRFELARIYLTRGDLVRALTLHQETLQLNNQLSDPQEKAISLNAIAAIYIERGELDYAFELYEESLKINKQLDNKGETARTLHQMANIYVKQGSLDRALKLYEESLQLKEQIGDKRGKSNSLSQLSNVYWEKNDYDRARYFLEQSIELDDQLGDLMGVAYNVVKLGQLSKIRGDKETALTHFRDGLAIFEKLGAQPRIAQVIQLIASLEGGAVSNDDPLAQALAQARDASQRGDMGSAIQYQEQAVSLAREAGEGRDELVRLSVLLYNLAGFYQKAERHDDAVKAMEEVVAIDEQTGHQDLESDRETLETLRRIAALTPEEREQLRQQAEEEQESPIENAANQVRDAGLAYVRKQAPKRDVLQMLEGASKQMKGGESAGSAWLEVAALCDALAALIKEESIPPVPAAYASHFSTVQSEMKTIHE